MKEEAASIKKIKRSSEKDDDLDTKDGEFEKHGAQWVLKKTPKLPEPSFEDIKAAGIVLNLEEEAIKNYREARANLIIAENAVGKIKIAEDLINESKEKLNSFDDNWLNYQQSRNQDYLKECIKLSYDARLISIDAKEKAKSVNLKLGMKIVISLFGIAFGLSIGYIIWHLYYNIPWFGGNYWFEIIIFSMFGVLTNLAYSAADHVLKQDFDQWHQGWYWSKIVQAPFISLVVILFLKNLQIGVLNVSIDFREASPEVMVAVAYIMGFYSRRTGDYLEKIKDWLMPPP